MNDLLQGLQCSDESGKNDGNCNNVRNLVVKSKYQISHMPLL